jgi:hypothetical protein
MRNDACGQSPGHLTWLGAWLSGDFDDGRCRMEKEHKHGDFAEGQEASDEHEHEEGTFAEGQSESDA